MPQVAKIEKKPLPVELMQTITFGMLNDTACCDWLLQYFHGDGFACPHCDQEITSERQRDAFQGGKRVCCKGCGRWFDHRSGTVLAATTLAPRQILLLALLIGAGLSPREIADRLGLHESTVRDWRARMSLTGPRVCVPIEIG